MKRKVSPVILSSIICIALAGCASDNQNESGTNRSEDDSELHPAASNMQVIYEDGYQLPEVAEGTMMNTYSGKSVDCQEWFESARSFLGLNNPIQTDETYEPDYAIQATYENGTMLSVSSNDFFYFTENYTNSADFLQLDPGEGYTGDLFIKNQEFTDFSQEAAYEKVKEFGEAVGYDFSDKYTVYPMDTETMEKANQRLIDAGDESALGAKIAQGEFYRFNFTPQEDGKDVIIKEATYGGGMVSVDALVSSSGIEMISIYKACSFESSESVPLVNPEKAQAVIEKKYRDIISDENVYVSDCKLCYYQNENMRDEGEIELEPVYAFSLKISKNNPESKVLVDACTGKEIIIQ